MNEPTLKQKKTIVRRKKNLFKKFEEVQHRTMACFRNYFILITL
jgi:hypothetical protein